MQIEISEACVDASEETSRLSAVAADAIIGIIRYPTRVEYQILVGMMCVNKLHSLSEVC